MRTGGIAERLSERIEKMMNQTKKHTTSKKLLALLLALIMTVSLLPMSVFAAEMGAETPVVEGQTQQDAAPVQEPDADSGEEDADVQPAEDDADAADDGVAAFAATDEEVTARDTSNDGFIRIFHLDCGRKYFSVSEINGIIDKLAENHYTHIQLAFGNNGFRFLLDDMSVVANGTTYSDTAVRAAVIAGNSLYSTSKSTSTSTLSESDMDSIIAHAKDKGISVIPLLNTPGHMDALVSAMQQLGLRSSTGSEMSLTSETELGFIKALQQKYITYFAVNGSDHYNFAADEYSFDKLDNNGYTAFAQYVNDTAAMIKAAGMTPMAYNDGINYSGKTTSVPFDTDIQICYWAQATNYASVQDLAKAGFTIINNNDAWYYVLGDYLYSIWADGQWGYADALNGIQTTPVTQAKNAADGEILVAGSVLCCWCDGPSIDYYAKGKKATQQTNQESVYSLIEAMATNNPAYFKGTASEQVELPPASDGNGVSVVVKGQTGQTATVTVEPQASRTEGLPEGAEEAVTYNVSPSVEGAPYTGAGRVTLPVPEAWKNSTDRIRGYIVTDGAVELLTGAYVNGEYTFAVPHFSEMGLLLLAENAGTTNETIRLTIGGTRTVTIEGSFDGSYNPDPAGIATVTVNAQDATTGTVDYKETSMSYSEPAGSNTSWTKTNYFHKVGDNYYPVYAYKVTETFIIWPTTYYYVGYSTDGGAPTEANIANKKENAPITVYEKNVTAGTPASTTITFTGVAKGTTKVKIGDVLYTIEVTDKFAMDDTVEIPITIVDYRADGLLFDYSIANSESSIAYQLVQVAHGYSKSPAQAAISGTTLTSLTPKDNAAGRGTTWATNGNGSYIRTGMVEETLGANGMPVYTDATVQYVAAALSAGKCRTDDRPANWNDILYNTFLVSSAPRSVRGSGTSGFSPAFQNSKTYDNITNAYDLAWYLLNTLYIGDTNMATVVDQTDTTKSYQLPIYGMADSTYNKLILVKDTDGSYYMKAYTDGAKIKYDEANGAIYNSNVDNSNISRFLYPLCDKGYDAYLGDTTDVQSGTAADTNYPARPNGNYTLRGESQFVYYADQNQYFEFTGDDDVYLFINNKLVLDLGGAHWSLTKRVNMNEIAAQCGLVDGEVATFTFFYMERFSDCSNFGIRTNMGLVERGIDAAKKAYSSDAYLRETPSGSVIENGTSQFYDLTLTNKGNQEMTNIKFKDTDDFNASVSFGSGVTSPRFIPAAADGAFKLADSGKYALFITDGSGSIVTDSQQTKETLAELSTAVAGISLSAGQTLHVRFLTVTANVPVATMAGYTNTLTVEAVSGSQTLRDSAIHQLYSYNASDTAKNYVVDFGLPLKITNIFDASAKDYIVDEKLTLNSTLQYGTLDINGTGYGTTLTYTLKDKATIDGVEKIILNVKYDFSGTSVTLNKTIHIIPASTVYYEDDFAKFTNADNTTVVTTGTVGNGFWQTVGTKDPNAKQALDKLRDPNANVYGYDPAYNSCTTFSLGSATKVTVDQNTKTQGGWPYATFTFKGTGFDIISLTDNKSGAIYVDVYKGNSIAGQRVSGYVVNNYYGYTYSETNGWQTTTAGDDNAIYQVPVIKVSDLTYGQYTVKIMVGYSRYQDVAVAGSYSFWLDAIRVYNPGGSALDNAYNQDGEKNPDFVELRKVLLDADSFGTIGTANGAVFIDGKGGNATVTDYKNYGPNHEVYLASGQAIAFQLVASGAKPTDLQLGAKLANGTSAELTITGAKIKNADKLALGTATDMFYQLSDIRWTQSGNQYRSGVITLTNSGTDMISLTNLKFIGAEYVNDASKMDEAQDDRAMVAMVMDFDAAELAVAAVDSVLHPQEVKTFAPERFEASWNRSSVKAGEKATLTVKTSEDVEAITVDGVTIDTYRTRTQRTGWGWNAKKVTYREFTYTITASETADHEIVAVNAEGTASEAITATLTVRAAAQRPGIGGWLNKLFSRWF